MTKFVLATELSSGLCLRAKIDICSDYREFKKIKNGRVNCLFIVVTCTSDLLLFLYLGVVYFTNLTTKKDDLTQGYITAKLCKNVKL